MDQLEDDFGISLPNRLINNRIEKVSFINVLDGDHDQRFEIDLSEKKLADRRSEWKQPDAKVKSGWLALYTANCRPASEGAAMQPW